VSNLRIERLPDASHWMQHEQPQHVLSRIETFLGPA